VAHVLPPGVGVAVGLGVGVAVPFGVAVGVAVGVALGVAVGVGVGFGVVGTPNPIDVFTPKELVVFHCCQSLEIVAAESLEIFGVTGQKVGSYHPQLLDSSPEVAL
jgi:hypothetical protein